MSPFSLNILPTQILDSISWERNEISTLFLNLYSEPPLTEKCIQILMLPQSSQSNFTHFRCQKKISWHLWLSDWPGSFEPSELVVWFEIWILPGNSWLPSLRKCIQTVFIYLRHKVSKMYQKILNRRDNYIPLAAHGSFPIQWSKLRSESGQT